MVINGVNRLACKVLMRDMLNKDGKNTTARSLAGFSRPWSVGERSGVTLLLPMSPTDSLFLWGEFRAHPMHVGGLALFTPPGVTAAAEVRELFERRCPRRRARCSVTSLGQWGRDDRSPSRKWTGATPPVSVGGRCPGGHGDPLR